MALPKATDQRFTYADYRQWSTDEHWEPIDGVAYAMAPAPTISHQTMTGQLFRQIDQALDASPLPRPDHSGRRRVASGERG